MAGPYYELSQRFRVKAAIAGPLAIRWGVETLFEPTGLVCKMRLTLPDSVTINSTWNNVQGPLSAPAT